MYVRLLVVTDESEIDNIMIGTIVIVLNSRKVGIKSSTGEMLWFALLPVEQPSAEEKAVEPSSTAS